MKEVQKIANLVSADGDILEQDLDDEPDMCEFIRSAVAADKFPGFKDLQNLDPSFLNQLDCPGTEKQTQVCAVTDSSYYNEKSWFILFEGVGLTFDSNPSYTTTKKALKKEEEKKKEEADQEESDDERSKRLEAAMFTFKFDSYRMNKEKSDNK